MASTTIAPRIDPSRPVQWNSKPFPAIRLKIEPADEGADDPGDEQLPGLVVALAADEPVGGKPGHERDDDESENDHLGPLRVSHGCSVLEE